MPKAMTYKANSVIYFKGDVSDRIFILKAGKVSLTSTDIETGQEIHDYIQTGEFFGVKSALGKYPREENAIVLNDSSVVMFNVPEFESMVSQNTRIIMKMLQVFSNQLRRIHKRVRNLLTLEEQVEPETGLYRIGEYYLRKKKYAQAVYAFGRYLTYYPTGKYEQKVTRFLAQAEEYSQKYGQGKGPNIPGLEQKADAAKPERGVELSETARKYYNAVSLFSQQKYQDAVGEFKEIISTSPGEEYLLKSLFELGRCLFAMEKYDQCIKHYTGLIQKYPKIPDLPDALFYIGESYRFTADNSRAASFYRKILSMSPDESLKRKTGKALKTVEEG
ncbi:MAG: tetratricopeptide repeat protein [Spirochaetia bacterium]